MTGVFSEYTITREGKELRLRLWYSSDSYRVTDAILDFLAENKELTNTKIIVDNLNKKWEYSPTEIEEGLKILWSKGYISHEEDTE